MLFNSIEFIFIFLPITLILYYFLQTRFGIKASNIFVVLASLLFYSWWRIDNLPILLLSVFANYGAVVYLASPSMDERKKDIVLVVSLIGNILFLGYFKYTNFFFDVAGEVINKKFDYYDIVLPLGISFFTFQKIGLLVDVRSGKMKNIDFSNYLLFVSFFPQLLAGPIVHHREVMPQFTNPERKFDGQLFCAGLVLFTCGLFKKVVIADTLANYVNPIFGAGADGVALTAFESWGGAALYTLQIYFDFSGYSDMAIGASALFGIRLPFNFTSPLKSAGIIEFWQRWHMTLGHFLAAYVYNPISLKLTRRRAEQGKSIKLFSGPGSFVNFLILVAFPAFATMVLAGIWHGAGLQFVVFGLIQATGLVINHAWRRWKRMAGFDDRGFKPLFVILTFLQLALSLVFFRSPDVPSALNMLSSMVDVDRLVLPQSWLMKAGAAGAFLQNMGVAAGDAGLIPGHAFVLILALLAVVWAMPNSLQICGMTAEPSPRLQLRLVPAWAMIAGFVCAVAVLLIDQGNEFLYFQF